MFSYVLVEDIKRYFKINQQHSRFLAEKFEETLLQPQQMVAELGLTAPLLELDLRSKDIVNGDFHEWIIYSQFSYHPQRTEKGFEIFG